VVECQYVAYFLNVTCYSPFMVMWMWCARISCKGWPSWVAVTKMIATCFLLCDWVGFVHSCYMCICYKGKHSLPKGTFISRMHMDLQWFYGINPWFMIYLLLNKLQEMEYLIQAVFALKIRVDLHIWTGDLNMWL